MAKRKENKSSVEKFSLIILNSTRQYQQANLTSPLFLPQRTKWSLEEKEYQNIIDRSSILANLLRSIFRYIHLRISILDKEQKNYSRVCIIQFGRRGIFLESTGRSLIIIYCASSANRSISDLESVGILTFRSSKCIGRFILYSSTRLIFFLSNFILMIYPVIPRWD